MQLLPPVQTPDLAALTAPVPPLCRIFLRLRAAFSALLRAPAADHPCVVGTVKGRHVWTRRPTGSRNDQHLARFILKNDFFLSWRSARKLPFQHNRTGFGLRDKRIRDAGQYIPRAKTTPFLCVPDNRNRPLEAVSCRQDAANRPSGGLTGIHGNHPDGAVGKNKRVFHCSVAIKICPAGRCRPVRRCWKRSAHHKIQ